MVLSTEPLGQASTTDITRQSKKEDSDHRTPGDVEKEITKAGFRYSCSCSSIRQRS